MCSPVPAPSRPSLPPCWFLPLAGPAPQWGISGRGSYGGFPVPQAPPVIWAFLVVSGLIGLGVGLSLYYRAIAVLGIALSSSLALLIPLLVGVASFFLFRERLTWVFHFSPYSPVCPAGRIDPICQISWTETNAIRQTGVHSYNILRTVSQIVAPTRALRLKEP